MKLSVTMLAMYPVITIAKVSGPIPVLKKVTGPNPTPGSDAYGISDPTWHDPK